MIDLAALTQAVYMTAPVPGRQQILEDASRLVSRLWQPCQTCDGKGRVASIVMTAPSVECPSCGGGRVEPTPQAEETVFRSLAASPADQFPYEVAAPLVASILMSLWQTANQRNGDNQ